MKQTVKLFELHRFSIKDKRLCFFFRNCRYWCISSYKKELHEWPEEPLLRHCTTTRIRILFRRKCRYVIFLIQKK